MSKKKKTTTKGETGAESKRSSEELTDEQLERVAGGFDGVKGESVDKDHKRQIDIA